MKVCFVGLGSIAKRHIRNLNFLCDEHGVDLEVHVFRHSKTDLNWDECDIARVATKMEDLDSHYDAVFITNPTFLHVQAIQSFLNYSDCFFVEKPVALPDQIDELEKINCDGKEIYVACPLRYSPVIEYIRHNVDLSKVLSVRCISSSYLPDWRRGTDYRKTYSASKNMGGGVSIDLIHEWDYITGLFGFPEYVKSLISKKSDLEIESDDIAIYIADYKDRTIEIHLDYFGRKSIREIMLITEEDTILGDLINNRISFLAFGDQVLIESDRDEYQKKELIHFYRICTGDVLNDNSIRHAIKVLKLTQGDG